MIFTKKTLIKRTIKRIIEINKINLKKFEIETRHSRHYQAYGKGGGARRPRKVMIIPLAKKIL